MAEQIMNIIIGEWCDWWNSWIITSVEREKKWVNIFIQNHTIHFLVSTVLNIYVFNESRKQRVVWWIGSLMNKSDDK